MNPTRPYSSPRNVMDAHSNIVHYCKNGQFSDAERTFQKMCEMIKLQPLSLSSTTTDGQQEDKGDNKWKRNYSHIQINNFQKSMATLVRYAPTIQDSLDYACFCLYEVPEPLRNESLEQIMTVNLIYLYKRQGGRDNMAKALELIKTGVALGYALPSETPSTFTNNSDAVFVDVSNSILRHFGLVLAQDKKSLL
ncbi:hypothetical protein BCR42DRAFT_412349 [Absidia repens]|uniref:Uncharacterized protein n=1 Tax=Absidia repens TaxID=90262 RepID=A0A1X2IJK7_9FUNG|nr:hypothetical protein BCR42DRAFT_412349 [Absidia repens]